MRGNDRKTNNERRKLIDTQGKEANEQHKYWNRLNT